MNKKFYNSPIIKEDIYGSNIGICFHNYHIINGREYVSATVQSDDLKNKLKQSKNSDALTLRSKIDEEGGELLILMRIKKTAS